MLRGLFERLRAPFGGDDEDETRRFRPSLLDRSVLFAHGSVRDDADRELHKVRDAARELEVHRRK
ncbi:hypothetical protein [Halorhabdus amylolytica]|uniref:hypothetical protein n=1 Tax=Halorhabdus amylolytica TaxID=2559573 RepID=UPI0010A9A45C|nr:hypothetical protein [Halorhabdus amylolytica]